jgi:hypothetical protein
LRKTINNSKADLFKHGNAGLAHLLTIVYSAGPNGIPTVKLLKELGSVDYGQALIRRAKRQRYIKRVTGESEHGHFTPIYNIITEKGKKLLKRLE